MLFHRLTRTHWLAIGVVVVGSAVAVLLVFLRPWSYDGPQLVSRTNGTTSGVMDAPGAQQYSYFTAGQVCIDGKGSAKILSIKPVASHGGMTVTDFAVMPQDTNRMGADRGRLRSGDPHEGTSTVSDSCIDNVSARDLYIEVLKPRAEDIWADGFEIKYVLGKHTGITQVRLAFGICEKDLDDCDTDSWESGAARGQ